MKRLSTILCLLALSLTILSSAPAEADHQRAGWRGFGRGGHAQRGDQRSRWDFGRDSRRQQNYCEYTDNGWEEHAAHSSCQECKALHGGCSEYCYAKSFQCKSEGVNSNGNRETFEAYSDYSESDARNQALDRCYSRASSCSVASCSDNNNLVSRRNCP